MTSASRGRRAPNCTNAACCYCVPSTGLDPAASGLKGRRPVQLDDEGLLLVALSGARRTRSSWPFGPPTRFQRGPSTPVWFTLQVVPGGRREVRTPVGFPLHRFRGGPICPLWHPSMCAVAAPIVGPAPAGAAPMSVATTSGGGGIRAHEGLLPAPLSRRARSASPAPLHVLWHRAPPNGDEPSG